MNAWIIMVTTALSATPVPFSVPVTSLEACQQKLQIVKKSWIKTAKCSEIKVAIKQ